MTEFERWMILIPVYILLAIPTARLVYRFFKPETIADIEKKQGR